MLTGTRVWKRITARRPWDGLQNALFEVFPDLVHWSYSLVRFLAVHSMWHCLEQPSGGQIAVLKPMQILVFCVCPLWKRLSFFFSSCTVHELFVTDVIRNFTSLIPVAPLAAGEVAGTQGMQSHGLLLWPWHHSVGKASCRRKELILPYETGRLKSWRSALTACYWGKKRRTCALCAGNSSTQYASRWDWVKRRQENELSAAKAG